MVGWHHWFNGHERRQTLRDAEGQGSLAPCSPWGCEVSDMTEWMNWTSLCRVWSYIHYLVLYIFITTYSFDLEGGKVESIQYLHRSYWCLPPTLPPCLLLLLWHRFGSYISPYIHILISSIYLVFPPFLKLLVYGAKTKHILMHMVKIFCS